MIAEIRVPGIDNQDCAVSGAAVPGLMLDRVVEGEGLVLLPGARLAADAEFASLRNDQRHVDDAANIGNAEVRGDVAARLQDREEDVRRPALDPADRKRFDQRRSAWRASTGLFETLAFLPQMESPPGERLVEP